MVDESAVILAAQPWPNNAAMIADCARMGYLRKEWLTLDPTYGKGNFWTEWQPTCLHKSDKFTCKPGLFRYNDDFTALQWSDRSFDAVVFDPPYKFNGTPSSPDIPYGVHEPTRWQDRLQLMKDGVVECARVLKPKGYLLVKCMDQVVSGKVVWQTDHMTATAINAGCVKVDRLDFLTSPRPQPHSRQLHARRNYSTLLIFRKVGA